MRTTIKGATMGERWKGVFHKLLRPNRSWAPFHKRS